MPTSGSSNSAQDRRAAQREEIRRQRMAELRRQRNIRTAIIAAVVVVVLAAVAGIGYAIYSGGKGDEAASTTAPTGLSASTPYYTLGAESGKPVVDLYIDFMCPYCGQFHQVNGADLDSMIEKKQVTVHMHTRTFLDANSSTGDYSTRAANAAACVWSDNRENFLKFHDLLYQNQPKEGSAGLTNAQLTKYAQQAGASDAVSSCISQKKYAGWLHNVVEKEAKSSGKDSTPYVGIDGKEFTDWQTPGAFAKAVGVTGAAGSDGGQ